MCWIKFSKRPDWKPHSYIVIHLPFLALCLATMRMQSAPSVCPGTCSFWVVIQADCSKQKAAVEEMAKSTGSKNRWPKLTWQDWMKWKWRKCSSPGERLQNILITNSWTGSRRTRSCSQPCSETAALCWVNHLSSFFPCLKKKNRKKEKKDTIL